MASMIIEQDGVKRPVSSSFFRGENANFYPNETSFQKESIVSEYITKGWMPPDQFITKDTRIAAFGSCFADNISKYLSDRGYNILTRKDNQAYVTTMGDGIVNTFAIRQQFEWAWLGKTPQVSLWHGYSAEEFGYDEAIRLETKRLFDEVEVFVITLGLSEVWYDEPTNEVFWRAVPLRQYDPSRHKFRISTVSENLENLRAIYRMIRTHRPTATMVFTVSPIPLLATFRNVSCLAANAVSKSILRVAIDELYREVALTDRKLFYFPSYEVVMYLFHHAWQVDRRHVQPRVLQFNMEIFERYYCQSSLDDAGLLAALRETQNFDEKLGNAELREKRREEMVRRDELLAQATEEAEKSRQARADR